MKADLIKQMDALRKAFKQEGFEADIKLILRSPKIMLVVGLTDKDVEDIQKMDCDVRVVAGD